MGGGSQHNLGAKWFVHMSGVHCAWAVTTKVILVISFLCSGLSALRLPSTLATHSDSGQKPLRHIGHNDANKENDSLQPAVAQDKGEPKENDTKEEGHRSDQMDEVLNLYSNGRLANFQAWCQDGNAAHYCRVSCGDHDASGCSCGQGDIWVRKAVGLVSTKRKLSVFRNKVETQGPLRGYVLFPSYLVYANKGLLVWKISEEIS